MQGSTKITWHAALDALQAPELGARVRVGRQRDRRFATNVLLYRAQTNRLRPDDGAASTPKPANRLRTDIERAVMSAPFPLTPREREVLDWVAAGKTNRDIAVILGASPRTIEKHLERVFEKLGVETRTAAVMRSQRGQSP
jgi:DNA-binding CsgD family transcriptional regulator